MDAAKMTDDKDIGLSYLIPSRLQSTKKHLVQKVALAI